MPQGVVGGAVDTLIGSVQQAFSDRRLSAAERQQLEREFSALSPAQRNKALQQMASTFGIDLRNNTSNEIEELLKRFMTVDARLDSSDPRVTAHVELVQRAYQDREISPAERESLVRAFKALPAELHLGALARLQRRFDVSFTDNIIRGAIEQFLWQLRNIVEPRMSLR